MKIGFATIGESPRDDVVPYIRERLPARTRILERGVLDGLSDGEIQAIDDAEGDGVRMVTRTRDGRKHRLAFERTLPRMQAVVDDLVEDGAEMVVIICGADWSDVRTSVPIINPGRLFPNLVQALAWGKRLGVVKPDGGQVERTVEQYRRLGLDVEVTAASPYGADRLEQAATAAALLRERGAEMIWMTCVGMDTDMKEVVSSITGRPIILARSILARVAAEFAD